MTPASPLWDLMIGFLSLGDSCEFGLVQRYCGAEPFDLFRFGHLPLDGLIGQLDTNLAAFADPSRLMVRSDRVGYEYQVTAESSGIVLHTEQFVGRTAIADVMRQTALRVPRLARKLAQELAAGERVAVYCRKDLGTDEIARLFVALRRLGPNRLLAVTEAPDAAYVGRVVKVAEGVLLGFLDAVQPLGNAGFPSMGVWLSVLRTANSMLADPAIPIGTVVQPSSTEFEVPDAVEAHLFWRAVAARCRGDRDTARALYAAYRLRFPQPDAFGHQFSSVFETS